MHTEIYSNPQILIAVIGGFFTVLVTIITYIKDYNLKKLEKEFENSKKEKDKETNSSLDIIMDLKFFNIIRQKVDDIFNSTSAERFLILFAINGKTDFNYVTVIYEQHKSNENKFLSEGAIEKYMNIEIDNDYRQYLKQSEIIGPIYLDYDKMQNNLLKNFYKIEGINQSIIKFIKRLKKNDDNDVLIFCSIAKREKNEFTDVEKTIIKANIDAIKGVANQINITAL